MVIEQEYKRDYWLLALIEINGNFQKINYYDKTDFKSFIEEWIYLKNSLSNMWVFRM